LSVINKGKWCCSNCKDNTNISISDTNNEKEIILEKDSNKILFDLKNSVDFMSKQFDDFSTQLRDIVKSVNAISEENKVLKEQNIKLKNELTVVNKKINTIEQKLIGNHIEIIGVPEKTNEDCGKIVETISKTLGEITSVEYAYRTRSKIQNKPGKIVAVLYSNNSKKTLMDLARNKKLKAKDIHTEWSNEGIYLNNVLTQTNSNLFYKTRMYAKKYNYKYVWFRDCKIFMRKDEKNKIIVIEDEYTLNNIV
jgi:regulator of replication initiation timing